MSQGPAVPTYILRGHSAPVHALLFLNANSFLASGDSDGWLVIWSLASKRPVAVWKAHDGGINGIKVWGQSRLITHGRDHKLLVWQVNYYETGLSTQLPIDGASEDQPKPWLLHSMDMSALNFCSFATCVDPGIHVDADSDEDALLIATPNALDSGGIDIFQLPTQRRVSQLPSTKSNDTGMVMAIALFYSKNTNSLIMISGYEDGQVMIHSHQGPLDSPKSKWIKRTSSKTHTQPVLSLDLSPAHDFFITSSADTNIAKFEIPGDLTMNATAVPLKTINTKHAGQQGLAIRSDSKIFETAGWDARVRVYSTKTLKELAVLKWHREGCYSTAFAEIRDDLKSPNNDDSETPSTEVAKLSPLDVIKHERSVKAQKMHWLAAGGKDGKISLWDIY